MQEISTVLRVHQAKASSLGIKFIEDMQPLIGPRFRIVVTSLRLFDTVPRLGYEIDNIIMVGVGGQCCVLWQGIAGCKSGVINSYDYRIVLARWQAACICTRPLYGHCPEASLE